MEPANADNTNRKSGGNCELLVAGASKILPAYY